MASEICPEERSGDEIDYLGLIDDVVICSLCVFFGTFNGYKGFLFLHFLVSIINVIIFLILVICCHVHKLILHWHFSWYWCWLFLHISHHVKGHFCSFFGHSVILCHHFLLFELLLRLFGVDDCVEAVLLLFVWTFIWFLNHLHCFYNVLCLFLMFVSD